MDNKRKPMILGWLLLCISGLVLIATVMRIQHTQVFGFCELLICVVSILSMLYGYALIHTIKSKKK